MSRPNIFSYGSCFARARGARARSPRAESVDFNVQNNEKSRKKAYPNLSSTTVGRVSKTDSIYSTGLPPFGTKVLRNLTNNDKGGLCAITQKSWSLMGPYYTFSYLPLSCNWGAMHGYLVFSSFVPVL